MHRVLLSTLAAALLLSSAAQAHTLPIHPTRMEIRAEKERLKISFEVDAVYFREEILNAAPPPEGWPKEMTAKMQGYVNSRLRLFADGSPLSGRLEECRAFYDPWAMMLKKGAWGKEGRIRCRLIYPLKEGFGTLSGKVEFHLDEWKEHLGRPAEAVPWPRVFEAHVRFPGRTLRLPIEQPEFSIPASEARRTSFQSARDSALAVCSGASAIPLALLGASLALWGFPERERLGTAAVCAATVLTGWVLAVPPPPAWLAAPAAWLFAGAAAALFWARPHLRSPGLFSLAVAVGPVLGDASSSWDPSAGPVMQRLGIAAGSIAWMALAYGATRGALTAHSFIQQIPPELTADFDHSRRRQAALLIAGAACLRLLGFWF